MSFHFEEATLRGLAERHRHSYAISQPFPHVVLDDFLPPDVLEAVLAEFPSPAQSAWRRYDQDTERKLAITDDELMGDATRHLLAEFSGHAFVVFLEVLTGIEGVIPDPHFRGGGLHQIERGGFLKIHADFNVYDRLRLDRRINVLLYLNMDWREEYGGHFELWDASTMSQCGRILPTFNRCVIFNTTDTSYHGHPEPLTCPTGWTRKSLALYYYTNGRPEHEQADPHGTLFRQRADERDTKGSGVKAVVRRYVPPVVLDVAAKARARKRTRN